MRSSGPLATAGGVRLSAPQIVIHAGTLVAFARDADHVTDRLWFRVLEAAPSADLATTVEQDGAGTWNGWYAHDLPQATTVPSGNVRRQASKPAPELRVAGMDLITVPPTVVSVKPAAADPCVLSDGQYVVVLRASDHGSLYVDRLQLRSSQERVQARTRTVYRLEQATEVRFQRSGLRDVPDGDTDSPSAVDLLGTPFAEPTYELPGVSAGAAFAATRVPGTGQAGTWHIAWVQDGAVQRYAFAQSSTDLVDLSRPWRRYAPLVPRLDGVALAPLPGRAPALGFYGELDATKTAADRTVDLPRAGRVALAVPVAGPTGLPFATAVVDCVLDTDGLTPDLSAADQTVTLVDGRLQGGTFTPDDSSPVFPTPAQAPSVSRLVDGLEVSGVLLGQVQPHTDPVLRAGEDGLLDLYVGGPPPDVIPPWGGLRPNVPAAVVAQFDPRVSRAVVALPWRYAEAAEQVAADVLLTARLSGPLPTGTTVSVSASRAGTPLQALADLCDVTVTYAAATGWGTETWTGVPREVGAFAAVLGGGSTDDTAAPAVVTGQTPFYDLGATRPQARLPLDRAGIADRSPVTPALTLVTARSSVPIEAVEVTADAPDRRTLRLTLRSDKGVEVRLVWAGLPALADAWPALLEGSAVGPTPGPGSTALLALATDAYQVDVPVLLLPATASADLSNLTITVVASLTGPAGTLDVTFVRAKDTVLALTAVPATVAGFAARLREADVVALGIAVDATGAAGAVLPTPGPVGPVSLGGWGALLDVVPPAGGASGLTVRDGTRPVARWGRTVLATPPAGQRLRCPPAVRADRRGRGTAGRPAGVRRRPRLDGFGGAHQPVRRAGAPPRPGDRAGRTRVGRTAGCRGGSCRRRRVGAAATDARLRVRRDRRDERPGAVADLEQARGGPGVVVRDVAAGYRG